ncbi:MAG: restriction endonuclease subunit S, partial [Lachnospiraceae bacterium]|nr:restriction endonuclease subunit S [Lachnospiraceae bacterium]
MSDVNALLEKLCPEGVEYKQIKDFARSIFRGAGIKREQLCDKGIPCVRYGEIYTTYGLWFEKCVSHTSLDVISSPKWVENGDILFAVTGESVDEISKATAYVGEEKCLAGGDIVVLKHTQNAKYLSYVLDSEMLKKQKRSGKVKSKVVHASISSIEQLVVPIPPLEIQEAIVNVLDRYSDAKEKLIHELALELDARKKQYEHYRDQILSFE